MRHGTMANVLPFRAPHVFLAAVVGNHARHFGQHATLAASRMMALRAWYFRSAAFDVRNGLAFVAPRARTSKRITALTMLRAGAAVR